MSTSPLLQRAAFVVVMLGMFALVSGLAHVVEHFLVLYPLSASPILTWPAVDLPPVA